LTHCPDGIVESIKGCQFLGRRICLLSLALIDGVVISEIVDAAIQQSPGKFKIDLTTPQLILAQRTIGCERLK
jgi:hypothetical protein